MKEVKTKLTVKDIKILDKPSDISRRMKNVYIRTKEQAEQTTQDKNTNYVNDAGDSIGNRVETAIRYTGRAAKRTRKRTGKRTGKTTIKNSQRTVKTFRNSAGGTVKTSQVAAKAAAVKSAQTTQRTLQAARATARAMVVNTKAAIKAMIAGIKAIIIATKSLIALITAGGTVAFTIILVICISGLLLSSAYGVFYSNEKAKDNTPVMKEVVSQLNTEFTEQIREIQNDNSHDTFEISGSNTISNWQEVLAVYAVWTTSSPSSGMEVATLDDEKVDILRNVFWDMNKIDYWLETVESDETVSTTDEEGNETTQIITVTRTILHINITSKSYTDMIDSYSFNPEQVEMLNELMKEEYMPLFMQLISS